MKKIILALILVVSLGATKAQFTVTGAPTVTAPSNTPVVSWTFTSKKIADKTYELHMTATVYAGYHLYAQNNNAEGPVPTTFKFTKNPLLTYTGKVKEVGKLVSKLEPVWGFKVNYYENKVDFVQIVKSRVTAIVEAKGIVNFMTCNDKRCLPPRDINFDIKIGGN